jgi:invasion protein IalB
VACKNKGCNASTAIAPDVLTAMRSGKQLKVALSEPDQGNHHQADAAG